MNRMVDGLLVLTVGLTTACSTPPSSAPAPPAPAPAAADASSEASYVPVVSLNEIMVYVVDPHANELWDAAVKPPASDAAWAELQHAAVIMAASGNLTRLSGNGPNDTRWTRQPNWAKYSQAQADAGLAAVTAVRAKDPAQVARAGDQLVLACLNCHREYKLDVPRIWTERQLPPEEQRR